MSDLSEAEYEAMLARIWVLMDAKPGTPEMAELERLCVIVEAYEDEHYPMGEGRE